MDYKWKKITKDEFTFLLKKYKSKNLVSHTFNAGDPPVMLFSEDRGEKTYMDMPDYFRIWLEERAGHGKKNEYSANALFVSEVNNKYFGNRLRKRNIENLHNSILILILIKIKKIIKPIKDYLILLKYKIEWLFIDKV